MACPYFYPEGGGLENYAYTMANGLVGKGFKVVKLPLHRQRVLSFSSSSSLKITVLCSTKEGKDKEETIDGVQVIMQKPDFIKRGVAG